MFNNVGCFQIANFVGKYSILIMKKKDDYFFQIGILELIKWMVLPHPPPPLLCCDQVIICMP